MHYAWFIDACWAVFIVYWIISSFSAKRTLNRTYGSGFWWRMGVIVIILTMLNFSGIRADNSFVPSQNMGLIGCALTALGVALAIWARVYLANNWGMPMSVKENPELVTTGPYAFIRHPIYTGALLAMFGSALVVGVFWGVVFVLFATYFIYSVFEEEKIMRKEFPYEYAAYMKRTKRLIPFIY